MPAAGESMASSVPTLGPDDEAFLVAAVQAGNTAVYACDTASKKASDGDMKAFARDMRKEHIKWVEDLRSLAAKKNLTLPNGPNAAQQQLLARLRKLDTKAFEQEYAAAIGITVDTQEVALFRDAAVHARDPAVKTLAEDTLPYLVQRLQTAQALFKSRVR
jgi:putative membrane protein